MLRNLKIENIAIIEHADIFFENGLNVMTGETGAGKSIVIDSINAVLGERTSKELVRTGSEKANVTAVFEIDRTRFAPLFETLGVECDEDGSLLISRTIGADGKNVCRVNGAPATVGMLKTIGRELINIHGQHDSQRLLNSESHCSFIDELAGNSALLERYRVKFAEWCAVKREISSMKTDDEEKAREIELLTYQINEIEAAQLSLGEIDELKKSRMFYRNSEKIIGSVNAAFALIKGDDETAGALLKVKSAAEQLDGASGYYEPLEADSQQLRDISYQLEEVEDKLRAALDSLEYDPEQAQRVDERLDYLHRLGRKYGADEQAMLDYLEQCRIKREKIEFSDQRLEQLRAEEIQLSKAVSELAGKITCVRKATGEEFAGRIKAELAFLDMPSVVFVVSRTECALNENGADEIEFLISANAGESPKPLAKIASGGELSRIMLAIKNVLSDKDGVDTLIFDEIDSGVSGRAAAKLGKKLSEVSHGRQVICVTHLAQIASQADHHFEISKSTHSGKTFTSVTPLEREGRKLELARILGGEKITQAQLDLAEELLTNK